MALRYLCHSRHRYVGDRLNQNAINEKRLRDHDGSNLAQGNQSGSSRR